MVIDLDCVYFDEPTQKDGSKLRAGRLMAFTSRAAVFRSNDDGLLVLQGGKWLHISAGECERAGLQRPFLGYLGECIFAVTQKGKHIIFLMQDSLACLDLSDMKVSRLSTLPSVEEGSEKVFSVSDDERYVTLYEPHGPIGKYDEETQALRIFDLQQHRTACFPGLDTPELFQFSKKDHHAAYLGRKYWQETDEWGDLDWDSDKICAIVDIDSMKISHECIVRKRDGEVHEYSNGVSSIEDPEYWTKVFPLKNGGYLCIMSGRKELRVYAPSGRVKKSIMLPERFPSGFYFPQLSKDESILFYTSNSHFSYPWTFIDIENERACVLVHQGRSSYEYDNNDQYAIEFDFADSERFGVRSVDFTNWSRDYGPIYCDDALLFEANGEYSDAPWVRADVSKVREWMKPLSGGSANLGGWSAW